MSDCRVFWGSHGCSLQRGHEEPFHVCDDCCRIEWSPEFGVWLNTYEGLGDQSPVAAFGEDVPPEFTVPVEKTDGLFRRWQREGRLATFVGGKWIYQRTEA